MKIKRYQKYLKINYIISSIFLTLVTIAVLIVTMDITNNSPVTGPLVEELAKLIALTFTLEFGIVFGVMYAFIEFGHYVAVIGESEGSVIWQYYLIRSLCFLLHIACLYIQLMGFKLYERINWKGYIIISFICAWLLHVVWNEGISQIVFLIIMQL